MLKTLSIWNFALIEYTQIDFSKGLNILTGETGAGKSILLGALGMVIGQRSNAEAIRTGKDFMRVEAVFSIAKDDVKVKEFLLGNNILVEDDTLIITRQITVSGRSSVQINNCHTTLACLRQLGELILDIHGQHSNQALLKTEKQLALVDLYGGSEIELQKNSYQDSYGEWLKVSGELKQCRTNTQEMAQRQDMLNWQITEIESARLNSGEDERLEAEVKVLANAEKIASLSSKAYRLLYYGENGSTSILEGLAEVKKNLESLERYDSSLENARQVLEEAYFQIQDSADEVRNYSENLDFSPEKLDKLQRRLDEIDKLKRKYGSSIDDILSYYEQAKHELDYIENYDTNIAELEQKLTLIVAKLSSEATRLHQLRQQAATELAIKIKQELATLGMQDAVLEIVLNLHEHYGYNGADEIEILFSANLGEAPKPLFKIVSGGELSRIALALKTITAKRDDIDLMVFDEVDTGVGGKTAQMMAEKIAQIAVYRQVICITHLPQIAAMSDSHFYISKESHDNKTFTQIEQIDYSSRLKEIARMMSGSELTQASLGNAEELLANARKTKDLLQS